MGEDEGCNGRENHRDHICVLRGKGLTSKIEHLSSCPNVACQKCGEMADCDKNVCLPVPLFI